MRSALFILAAACGLFAIGLEPDGRSATSEASAHPLPYEAPPPPPTFLEPPRTTTIPNIVQAPPAAPAVHTVPASRSVPVPVRLARAPAGYICGPSGCYLPAAVANRTYAAGSCYGGSCASYGGGGERAGMFRRAPVRRFIGRVFGRRR